jgi:hypothetical protein
MRHLFTSSRSPAAGCLRRESSLSYQQAINVLDALWLTYPPITAGHAASFGDVDFEARYNWVTGGRTIWVGSHHLPSGELIGTLILPDVQSVDPMDYKASPHVVPVRRSRIAADFAGIGPPWLVINGETAALLPPGRVRMYSVATMSLDGQPGPTALWLADSTPPPLPAGDVAAVEVERSIYRDDEEAGEAGAAIDSDPVAHVLAAICASPDDSTAWNHAHRLPLPGFDDGLFGGPLWDLPIGIHGASLTEVDGAERLASLASRRWPHLSAELDRRSESPHSRVLAFEDELSLACAPYASSMGRPPAELGEIARWFDTLTTLEAALHVVGDVQVADFVEPGCDWILDPIWGHVGNALIGQAATDGLTIRELLGTSA